MVVMSTANLTFFISPLGMGIDKKKILKHITKYNKGTVIYIIILCIKILNGI